MTSPIPQHEDTAAVRKFFNQWDVYKSFVSNNYLHHREAMEAVAAWLDARGAVGAFLDLGCGDAAFTSKILGARNVRSYTGIDCSPIALELAAKNLAASPFPSSLICADFFTELPMMSDLFDVIFIGLSFHHLPAEDKTAFLRSARARIAPAGCLVFFEPTRLEGEDREAFMRRMTAHAHAAYTHISPDQLAGALAHIRSADFPETAAGYRRMALDAGFAQAGVIYTCPESFFAVVTCSAGAT